MTVFGAHSGMPTCDNCDERSTHVWRHEVIASETSRPVVWLCRSCHPEVRTAAERDAVEESGATESAGAESTGAGPAPAAAEAATDAEAAGDTAEVRPDGGALAAGTAVSSLPSPDAGERCPTCGSATVNGQGMCRCPDCGWTGSV